MYFPTLLLLAIPTLAAPLFQTQVESLRAGGMSERDILTTLHAHHPTPAYTGSPVYTLSQTSTVYGQPLARDTEGDVSPGSAPEFHFAEQRFTSQLARFISAKAGGGAEYFETSDRPAWIFEWMGGVWRSAASKKGRAKWIA